MKAGLLRDGCSLPEVFSQKLFDNGALVRVYFDEGSCFLEVLKTFKNKDPESLSVLSFEFDGESRSESSVFQTEYMRVDLHSLPINELFGEFDVASSSSEEVEGISALNDNKVVYLSVDRRVFKVAVVNMESDQSIVGEIKLLKSLKFQQGKSVQEGMYSDAFLTRTIGIPKATLSRWKLDKGWRRNVYDLINSIELPQDQG